MNEDAIKHQILILIKRYKCNFDELIIYLVKDLQFGNHPFKEREIIKYLISKGADINYQDQDGKTALHHSYLGRLAGVPNVISDMLINLGCDPQIKDNFGNKPEDCVFGEIGEWIIDAEL